MQRKSVRMKNYDPARARAINPAQLGGIETSVLDDGPARGVRIAWVNTGSSLRYKVLIDRGLDIADAFHGPHSLAFLSFTGSTPPTRALDRGLDWLRGFYGGLVCSCGPQHVGGPETVEGVEYGLHGTHSNTPAQAEIVCQPDPAAGITAMSITGTVRTARVFGPNVEMRRTIRSVLGQPGIGIHDVFLNRGNAPVRHCWLLHCNFGWPLVDKGTRIVYRGEMAPRPDPASRKWFRDERRFRYCPGPVEEHRGAGEACAFIDPPADRHGRCHVGLVNERLSLGVEIAYPREQFPRLTNWQHYGPGGEYVVGLEPISGGMGCGAEVDQLAPGQTRCYDCTITVHSDKKALKDFIRAWGA